MKKLLTISIAIFVLNTVGAQDQSPNQAKAHTTTIDAKGKSIDAEEIQFNVSEDMLSDVFEKKMRSVGAPKKSIKWKLVKGASYYPATNVGEVSLDKMDYYYVISGNKKESKLTVFASRGYDNFITKEQDPEVFQSLARFLESLNADLVNEDWQQKIDAQEEVISKSNKELEKDNSDLQSMEKQLSKLQQDIEAKKAEIEQDKADLAQQQDIMEKLKSKSN